MKFYIAARTAKISEVNDMTLVLEEKGHECTHNWATAEDAGLGRPYHEHAVKASKFAADDIAGARDADVFVILGDKGGTGMYVEMGAALSHNAKVYAIGAHNDETVFHFHPHVTRVDTFEAVLKDLGQ